VREVKRKQRCIGIRVLMLLAAAGPAAGHLELGCYTCVNEQSHSGNKLVRAEHWNRAEARIRSGLIFQLVFSILSSAESRNRSRNVLLKEYKGGSSSPACLKTKEKKNGLFLFARDH
jgi:hypothetical protein